MQIITTEGSFEFMDYSQLSYESGIWVIESYDLVTKSVRETKLGGDVLAIVNCP